MSVSFEEIEQKTTVPIASTSNADVTRDPDIPPAKKKENFVAQKTSRQFLLNTNKPKIFKMTLILHKGMNVCSIEMYFDVEIFSSSVLLLTLQNACLSVRSFIT